MHGLAAAEIATFRGGWFLQVQIGERKRLIRSLLLLIVWRCSGEAPGKAKGNV
jgi:hypothetical protein